MIMVDDHRFGDINYDNSHGFPLVFPWFRMGFLWFSYDGGKCTTHSRFLYISFSLSLSLAFSLSFSLSLSLSLSLCLFSAVAQVGRQLEVVAAGASQHCRERWIAGSFHRLGWEPWGCLHRW